MNPLKIKFLEIVNQRFPLLQGKLEPLISEAMFSPTQIKISKTSFKEIKTTISSIFNLRESDSYRSKFRSHLIDPGNNSILMSYDFHLTDNEELKLIEINTNASFLAIGSFMNKAHGLPEFDFEILKQDINNELKLFGRSVKNPNIAIIDEKPSEQRLFSEFLLYQQIFNEWGWHCEIKDITEVTGLEDIIYNRYTDFYLHEKKSAQLFDFYQNKKICFSPHPYEYFLLADKQRLIDISGQKLLNIPQILKCFPVLEDNKEELWTQRKGLFFKPLRSFGSKQAYRGASISRKAFDELTSGEFIAQEYIPPGEKIISTPDGDSKFKFDLRCYAYQGQLEFITARVYQGQVTNMRTPYGGFAPVVVI